MEDEECGSSLSAENAKGPLYTENEVVEVHIKKPAVVIAPETPLIDVGRIYAIVENVVVVMADTAEHQKVLDAGSLFVFEDREVMGE
ncbi:hypothetical protein BC937DRAFT_92186, partial [Endogone sp. FLAS-F59071]